MEADEIIAKGKTAEKLMENPVLREALEAIKRKAITAFSSSQPLEADKRESAYYTLKAIEDLELQLDKIKSDGVYEAEKAKRRAK